jgi:hypothetical protein
LIALFGMLGLIRAILSDDLVRHVTPVIDKAEHAGRRRRQA